ncbi:MAG: hypothetical protein IPP25_16440 [Saprospiraceae bacterium]|nr:hypothetical protein [Candidatus Opimibacter skivensis]
MDGISEYDHTYPHAWRRIVFDTMIAVPFANLRQQNRPIRFLLLKLGSIFLNIALVLFFVELLPWLSKKSNWVAQWFTKDDIIFYVILSNLLSSAITFALLLPLMRHQPLRWDWGFLKKMLGYSWPLVIVGFAGVINQYSSIAFQKYLLPGDTISNLSHGGIYCRRVSWRSYLVYLLLHLIMLLNPSSFHTRTRKMHDPYMLTLRWRLPSLVH